MNRLWRLERLRHSPLQLAIGATGTPRLCMLGGRGAVSSVCAGASVRWLAPLIVSLPIFANTFTSADISGFGTNTITATAVVSYLGADFGDPSTLETSQQLIGTTVGPLRWGIIELTASGTSEFGGGTADVGEYSFGCAPIGCYPVGFVNGSPFPFLLGAPFEVNVTTFASNNIGMGSAEMSFQFSLFEAVSIPGFAMPVPGASVTIFDPPPGSIPEPATFASFSLGLLSLTIVHRARRGKYRKSIGPVAKQNVPDKR